MSFFSCSFNARGCILTNMSKPKTSVTTSKASDPKPPKALARSKKADPKPPKSRGAKA
jgi:hypothetical protein